MRQQCPPPARSRTAAILADRRGFALEATLIVLVLISLLVGASVAGYVMVQRAGSVDYRDRGYEMHHFDLSKRH